MGPGGVPLAGAATAAIILEGDQDNAWCRRFHRRHFKAIVNREARAVFGERITLIKGFEAMLQNPLFYIRSQPDGF